MEETDAVSETIEQLQQEGLRRFRPYPAYRNSGVEWLGNIPAHWEVKRLKELASVQLSNVDKKSLDGQEPVRLCNYTDVYYNEQITPDLEFMSATATREQVRRFALRAGDVLITKDSESWTDIAVPAVVTEDMADVLCGYHLAHIHPENGCTGAFLSRAFAAIGPRDQFQVAANGITRFGLGGDAIRTGQFAIPPEPEQRTIAAFLDRETAKIDGLVARKERLIELLQEKRAALITRAVTRGLDSDVPTKDSGVEWLGEIPEHWEAKRFKAILVRNDSGVWGEDFSDDGVVVLRSTELTEDGNWVIEEPARRLLSAREADQARLEVGDLVVTKSSGSERHIGKTSIVDESVAAMECCFSNFMQRLRLSGSIPPRFYWYLMNCLVAREQLVFLSTTTTGLGNLSGSILGSIWVPVSHPDEQRAIVAFLDHETAKIDALIAKIREAIDRLKEFRTVLISAAVTGKIDVREKVS